MFQKNSDSFVFIQIPWKVMRMPRGSCYLSFQVSDDIISDLFFADEIPDLVLLQAKCVFSWKSHGV